MQQRQPGPYLHRPSAGVWLPHGGGTDLSFSLSLSLSSTDWNMPPVIPDKTGPKADKEERDNQKNTSSPQLQEQALL